ncbi:hypothetical protein SASPL_116174 [Salvia splendens]|uniref:Calponin-homology (CH) domain-containing protein n=1 Tax=Salvia splendens TaxID=180675 RepID=A0A8X8XT93_SALSN|nr:hypothetical protein SASPL_116174 [Salvia splendens]
MSSFVGVIVSDPWLQSQFTQVELRGLKSKFLSAKNQSGNVTFADLPPVLAKLKEVTELTENEITDILKESSPDLNEEVDFETFLRHYLDLQAQASAKVGGPNPQSSFLKATTTTLHHTISESEKSSYVAHINNYLGEDPFLKDYLPLDPASDDIFELAKDGVLLCKLINVAVPNTIDERAINTKKVLNPWERNENHTLCLNSAKAIGCTVVNIGTQDLIEARPHLVVGLMSQIIKIQLLSDLDLKKTPQLVELVEDTKDVEELMGLAPEKVLLKWMNFHLKRAGFEKQITNFSSDLKDGEAYAHLLNALAPELGTNSTLETTDPTERAKLIIEQAEKLDCKRYVTPKDIVDGSANLNLAFVAQIFQHRNGLSVDQSKIPVADMMEDDAQTSREERCFRLWINSLGIETHVNNLFDTVRGGWVLLEVLEKASPGSVNWKQASKTAINMPFKKLENCNQVVSIGKDLNFSMVNIAGNDIAQGNKKLIIELRAFQCHNVFTPKSFGSSFKHRHNFICLSFAAFLWQLMRFSMLNLLKNLRQHSHGKEIGDADILNWANEKVKRSGRSSQMESFKDKNLATGRFFLELLSSVEPRVVNWALVTKGTTGIFLELKVDLIVIVNADEDKKSNATYIISVARKLGCSIFLLPEDIIEVNQKMILTLTASIMYWSLQKKGGDFEPLSPSQQSEPPSPSQQSEPSSPSLSNNQSPTSPSGDDG